MKNQSSFYIDIISHSSLFKHNQQGAKLIQEMQTEIPYRTHLSYLDQSDQEALNLFDNLNPNQDDKVSDQLQQEQPQQDDSIPHLGRLSRMNQQSKKDKKRSKKKEKRRKMMQRMKMLQNQGTLSIATPQKSKRKQKRIKEHLGSDSDAKVDENINSSDMGSDSENKQDLMNELRFLNPDAAEDEQPSTAKRLKKSNRKIRLEQKEGFKLDELGNDPQVNNDELQRSYEDQDYSLDDIDKKKKQRKKLKVKTMTNEQILNNLKQHQGIVEQDGEQNMNKPYDNGLDTLYAMKGKKKGGIKINNRMFCDLQIDQRDAEAHVNPPQNLQLQIKPKNINPSSTRFNFLSKAENLKKQRGLEANIDKEDYQRKQQQRVKTSVAQIVNTLKNTQFQAEIQVQIKIPTISRGKSADIINNTVFLKSFSSKSDSVQTPGKIQTLQNNFNLRRKENYTRKQFYQQIHEQSRLRKSKFISEQHLKQSFKKTNLQQLQQARKRIQQKKRKQALSEQQSQSESEQLDSQAHKMQELLQQQERICGDINEEPQNAEEENQNAEEENQENIIQENIEEGLKQVAFTINVEGQNNVDIDEKDMGMKTSQQKLQAEKENNQQYANEENEIIDELASASHFEEREAVEEQPENEDEESSQEEQQNPQTEEPIVNQQDNNGQMFEMNQQDKLKKMELQEEGIMIRKKKIDHHKTNKISVDKIVEQTPQKIVLQKQNQINITNKVDQDDKSYSKQLAELKKDDFTGFKKLRNFARVMAEKRRKYEQGKKYAAQYIEQEAQQGSDNQDHDDIVKKINYEDENKQYEGIDLDADLAELIDNAVDLNEEDEFEAFRKYLEDIKIKDREQIKQIIRGEFRSKHDDIQFQIDEDDKKRQERMEEVMNWMKKRQEEQGKNIYLNKGQDEDEGENSDSEFSYKEKKKEPQVESDHIPEQQEQAMIQKFLENTLPSGKKESRPMRDFDLGPLPESVRLEKTISKTISLTRMGSKHSSDSGTSKLKRTSSLVNEILNKNNTFKFAHKKIPAKAVK